MPYLETVQELLDDGTPSILIEHSLATRMENDAKKFITNITKERSL